MVVLTTWKGGPHIGWETEVGTGQGRLPGGQGALSSLQWGRKQLASKDPKSSLQCSGGNAKKGRQRPSALRLASHPWSWPHPGFRCGSTSILANKTPTTQHTAHTYTPKHSGTQAYHAHTHIYVHAYTYINTQAYMYTCMDTHISRKHT